MCANISKNWFERLARVSIVFLVLVIIDFIVIEIALKGPSFRKHDAGKPDEESKWSCYKNCTISYYVNIISMSANFTLYSYLEGVKYASDKRWS